MRSYKFIFIFLIFCLTSPANAVNFGNPQSIKRQNWLDTEATIASAKIRSHLNYPGITSGVVIASPQKANPNYFRHWVRDAALTMRVIVTKYQLSSSAKEKEQWEEAIWNYINFSKNNQSRTANFGEPIFEVTGDLFIGPWGRPQNDGPALRAITLIAWANLLIDRGDESLVKSLLYEAKLASHSIIKADLEYVAGHWKNSSFDLWEEVRGDHFYTRMAHYRALQDGADLADRLQDPYAANWYRQQALALKQELKKHWNGKFISATLNFQEGANYKNSNLDVAVLLAVLHSENDLFPVPHSQIQLSFQALVDRFSSHYVINTKFSHLAPAIGRYPEDLYGGTHFNGGNPWVLATLAAAEYCFRLSANTKSKSAARAWFDYADSFVARVAFHANSDGSLSEQIDKDSGYMVSAQDLTWNYAAVLTTHQAREQALINIKTR